MMLSTGTKDKVVLASFVKTNYDEVPQGISKVFYEITGNTHFATGMTDGKGKPLVN